MPIIKRDHVRVDTSVRPAAPAAVEPMAPACQPAKRVELVRLEGVVRAIELTCSCGEVTVLELAFEAPSDDPDPAPAAQDSPESQS